MTKPEIKRTTEQGGRLGIRVDITLGMARHDCRFHGICRLDVDEQHSKIPSLPECGKVRGWLFVPHPEYCLICFDSRTMRVHCRKFHFGRRFFQLGQAIAAGSLLEQQLGYRIMLREGQYRIQQTGIYFSVLFKMEC